MTVPTWNLKRGDTWVAPQAILITVDGSEVDLSTGYELLAQLRTSPDQGGDPAATFAIDDDLLADSKVLLSLTYAQTETLARGTHYVDLQVTSDDPAVGRKSSQTWTIEVDPDVSKVDA